MIRFLNIFFFTDTVNTHIQSLSFLNNDCGGLFQYTRPVPVMAPWSEGSTIHICTPIEVILLTDNYMLYNHTHYYHYPEALYHCFDKTSI